MPPPKLPRPKGKLVAINKQTGEQIDMGPWVCIYPCYINKSLSIAKGRKVSKEIGKHAAQTIARSLARFPFRFSFSGPRPR